MIENNQQEPGAERLVGVREVLRKTSLSRTSLWRLARTEGFPASVTVFGTRKAWREAEIDAWILKRGSANGQ